MLTSFRNKKGPNIAQRPEGDIWGGRGQMAVEESLLHSSLHDHGTATAEGYRI